MKISIFPDCFKCEPIGERDLKEIFYAIATGVYAEPVQKYVLSGKDADKLSINAFTPCGSFSYRKDEFLTAYSYLIVIDVDNVTLTAELAERLRNDKYVRGFFKSPSQLGFKVFVQIDSEPDLHIEAFRQVIDYLSYEYDIPLRHGKDEVGIDLSGSNISRLCIFSSDPAAYYNADSFVFHVEDEFKPSNEYPNPEGRAKAYCGSEIEAWVQHCEANEIDLVNFYNDWTRIGFALIRSESKEAAKDHFHRLSKLNAKYDSKECDKKFKQLQDEPTRGSKITVATLVWTAKKTGYTLRLSGQKPKDDNAHPSQKEPSKHDFLRTFTENYRVNEITLDVEVNEVILDESEYNAKFLDASEKCSKISKAFWDTWMSSGRVPKYNPIKEYFEKLDREKDSTDALNRWIRALGIITGLSEDEFAEPMADVLLRKWVIGIVASVYGRLNLLMPVLIGEINTGKTEAFKRLLPNELQRYYTSYSNSDNDGKALKMQFCESLIMSADEMTFADKVEAKSFRKMISESKFTYKPPYGRKNIQRRRLASFCGTSNPLQIIQDPQYNRRVIPCEITKPIDFAVMDSIDREEVMVDAYRAFKSGESFEITQPEITWLHSIQDRYSFIDVAKESILTYFEPANSSTDGCWMSVIQLQSYLDGRIGKIFLSTDKLGTWFTQLGFKGERRYDSSQKQAARGYWVKKLE